MSIIDNLGDEALVEAARQGIEGEGSELGYFLRPESSEHEATLAALRAVRDLTLGACADRLRAGGAS